jgi:uncharacterized membrane protein YhaH (DUF805 family)
MGFQDAVVNGLLSYWRFQGRATRRELGFWLLAVVGGLLAALLLDAAVLGPAMGFAPFAPEAGRPLTVLTGLGAMAPTLAVAGRRLHDAGRSSRWLWLLAAPVLGWLALGWMLTRPGAEGVNRWGEPVVGLYRT